MTEPTRYIEWHAMSDAELLRPIGPEPVALTTTVPIAVGQRVPYNINGHTGVVIVDTVTELPSGERRVTMHAVDDPESAP